MHLKKTIKWYSQFNCFSEKYIQELCKQINPKSKVLFHKINFEAINVKEQISITNIIYKKN